MRAGPGREALGQFGASGEAGGPVTARALRGARRREDERASGFGTSAGAPVSGALLPPSLRPRAEDPRLPSGRRGLWTVRGVRSELLAPGGASSSR